MSSSQYIQRKPVERLDLDDHELLPQTINHHLKRYEFAALFAGLSFLDLPCGKGYGSDILKSANPDAYVLGIDCDVAVVREARNQYPGCNFVVADIRKQFTHNQFDTIVFFEGIEHLTFEEGLNTLDYLCTHNLKKYGTFIVSTPRDIQDHDNIYHKSSWSHGVFQRVLSERFSSVEVFGQSWATGEITDIDVATSDFYIGVCRKE